MTKKEFLKIEEKEGFDTAIEKMSENCDLITTYDNLKDFAVDLINNYNMMFALHILNAIYNSDNGSDYYYYDYSAGTTCTPSLIKSVDDLEEWSLFEKE